MLRSKKVALLVCLTTFVFALFATVSSLQAQDEASARRLFHEGLEAYKKAEYETAYNKFNEFLKISPPTDLVLQMRDMATYAFFVKALSATDVEYGKDIAFVLKKILELAARQVKLDMAAESRVTELLNKVRSPEFTEKYMAMELIASQIGQYVVPFCVEALGSNADPDYRTEIIVLLSRLGRDATLPVIQLLKSDSLLVKQAAVFVLGNTKDERAVPALKKLIEDPNEDPTLKKTAVEAIVKTTGLPPAKFASATEYFYRLAERYYYSDPKVIQSNYKDWVYWFWFEGELKYRVVEGWEYSDLLAEDACYEGLSIAEHHELDDLWTLLACVYFAQLNQVETALETVGLRVEKGVLPTEYKTKLESRLGTLQTVHVINYGLGTRRLYKALRRSMDDRNVPVAVSCIEALGALQATGDLLPEIPKPQPKGQKEEAPAPTVGSALVNALVYPDKRVRYAAACALIRMNPKKEFIHNDKVMVNIKDALGEWKPRVVLVIEPDQTLITRTSEMLTDAGFFPVSEQTGALGIRRARMFPTKDLVIISTELPDYKAYEIIDLLKNDPRTQSTPVIVTTPASKMRTVQNLYTGSADAVIDEHGERLALVSTIENIFADKEREVQPDTRVRADEIAMQAAKAIQDADLTNRNFRATDALEALIANISSQRSDPVRVEALKAIGHLGMNAESARPHLVNVLSNRRNVPEVRIAAANALADILRQSGEPFSPETYTAALEVCDEDNIEVRKAAAKVLGSMNKTSIEDWPIFDRLRVHKNKP